MRTDHQAIHWLFSLKEPKDRLARWLETLSRYQFRIEHRPGKKHGNADALSHRQCNPYECDCPLLDEDEELLQCGPCHKCKHRSQTMQSDLRIAEGDHEKALARPPQKAVAMASVEVQTDDVGSESSSITLQVGNAGISKSHRCQMVRDKGIQVDHGLQAPKKRTKSWKFGRSGRKRQSGGRPLPVAKPSAHDVVCCWMTVADKTLDTQALSNGVTLIDSAAEIRAKQLRDPDIAPIIKWKEKGSRPSGQEVTASSPTTKHYWLTWGLLSLEDGVLLCKFSKWDGTGEFDQIIAPRSIQKELLHHLHKGRLGGHLGRKRTVEHLLQNYYWHEMHTDVEIYVQQCEECQ